MSRQHIPNRRRRQARPRGHQPTERPLRAIPGSKLSTEHPDHSPRQLRVAVPLAGRVPGVEVHHFTSTENRLNSELI